MIVDKGCPQCSGKAVCQQCSDVTESNDTCDKHNECNKLTILSVRTEKRKSIFIGRKMSN